MKKYLFLLISLFTVIFFSNAQDNNFTRIDFILGNWSGTGSGFGNEKSKINSSFQLVMEGKYIEVINESQFEPTTEKPEGEHHIDKGFISFDKVWNVFVFRQFNNEGYINRYILNDSLSNNTTLVFETEEIENFVPGGKARWTIKKVSDIEMETTFDVSFPNRDYACFGTNNLVKE